MNAARTVGLFTLGALFIGAALVIYVGSLRLFSQEETFLLYFDESINGLASGAPVKFKGVPVGEVTEIRIRYNQADDSSGIPVFIKIDTTRLRNQLGVDIDIGDEEEFASAVREGLRGQLEVASLISGQLFVDLDYVNPPVPPPVFEQLRIEYKEIPTVPSALALIGANTSEIVAQITSIDVQAINDQTLRLLSSLNNKVAAVDVAGLTESLQSTSTSLRATSDSLRTVMEGDTLDRLMREVETTAASYRTLAATADQELAATGKALREGMTELEATLRSFDQVALSVDTWLAEDGEFSHEALELLRELRETADGLQQFISFLERNPRALLTGRETP